MFCHYNREPVYADVVFIHGLLGGPFRTWRQSDLMKPSNLNATQNPTDSSKGTVVGCQLGCCLTILALYMKQHEQCVKT